MAGHDTPAPNDTPIPPERADEMRRYLADLGIDLGPGSLMEQALTHRSFASEQGLELDNERLEFLGDAVIHLVVSERLFRARTDAAEGELSKLRASLVSRNNLGQAGRQLGLGEMMRLGEGERRGGGMQRLSTVGSCLEAVIGAIYLTYGLAIARAFLERFVIDARMMAEATPGAGDSKSRLQEVTQRLARETPTYRTVESSGPDHAPMFTVEVLLGGRTLARGEGRRIKEAENVAAEAALLLLEQESEELTTEAQRAQGSEEETADGKG